MPSMLTDYRVLDLTDEKGFFCGRILGDFGADVIKVEKPGGDRARNIGPFYKDMPHPEKSLYWFFYNFNKRGITLDIETEDGRDIFRRLAERAEFLIESFPPGYLEKLGLGFEALRKMNPKLVMTSITPYGQKGPYKDFKTADLVSAAAGGLVFILGDEDRPPVRITAEQSYPQAGAHAASASLMAHHHRQVTGEGQHVDVSIEECMAWPLSYTIPFWDCLKKPWFRAGGYQKRAGVSVKSLFPCKDGYVNFRIGVAALMGRSMENFVKTMIQEGYGLDMKDVDWKSIGMEDLTQQDHDRWVKPMEEYLKQHTKKELYELALKNNFMLTPVNSPKDVAKETQLEARNFWAKKEHPELGETITYPGPFYKSTETEWRLRYRAPRIGEHNRDIYEKELGFSPEQVIQLKQAKVI